MKSQRILVAMVGLVFLILIVTAVKTRMNSRSRNVPPLTLTGNEQGLVGSYLGSTLPPTGPLQNVLARRIDSRLEFEWTGKSPDPAVPMEDFSVVWTGKIHATQTGQYFFSTMSDDGVMLWIDGHLVIDDWKMHGLTKQKSFIRLIEGWHDIRFAYVQFKGKSFVRLTWTPPNGRENYIPVSHLTPANP